MHEYSIVSALLERVDREAQGYANAVVRVLHLRIGEQAGVELELLRTAFETCRANGACATAELAIEVEPARWACTRCARPIERGAVLRCPDCARPARMLCGEDIILSRIEMEVPDV